MAQAIIRRSVEDATYRVARREAATYLREDLVELRRVQQNAEKVTRSGPREWDDLSVRLTLALEALVATADKQLALGRIADVADALRGMEAVKTRYERDQRIAQRKLDAACSEANGYLDDFVDGLRSREMGRLLEAEPPIVYTLPLIGETTVPMKEALKRADFRDTLDAIRKDHSLVAPPEIAKCGEELYYPILTPYDNYGGIYAAVEHINSLNYRISKHTAAQSTLHQLPSGVVMDLTAPVDTGPTRNITALPDLFESVLNIVIPLQVAEPDTSKDHLLVEVIQLCEGGANNRARMMVIAGEVGLDVPDLRKKRVPYATLCRMVQEAISG